MNTSPISELLENSEPDLFVGAFQAIIVPNPSAKDKVTSWIIKGTDQSRTRALGAISLASALYFFPEENPDLVAGYLARSWIGDVKDSPSIEGLLHLIRMYHGAAELADALWMIEARNLFRRLEADFLEGGFAYVHQEGRK